MQFIILTIVLATILSLGQVTHVSAFDCPANVPYYGSYADDAKVKTLIRPFIKKSDNALINGKPIDLKLCCIVENLPNFSDDGLIHIDTKEALDKDCPPPNF
ncbi:hypothetical protein MJO28_016649 [Puccinia striiformis f. sp. tritici]|uniref:Uncharacterized protein n=4 Tax=Puccinia striiformis TaxID=27350 RepID=A0A0L0V793_9BASI|nr:hypothetical protein Pst134EA_030272 [Puccinia striiformis f. sp. tritici]KAI9600319.1 hypothetical protein H4Q26_000098 [Puccinia striiformis f. sp. tritici PST-130]KNE95147.1 hypothetical protein PSTG_11514 [Puccinia striiformis f. sp. tritici PST-78]POW05022.1 hypothetical protein PSHT_10984 [Puccinia striiformis]KAH9440184.1 hypothetical protein Pst134EB_030812 [Puccinia striiformis f. sp. tritici]KAH9446351.1 hypothetical protein Pst134EA_030272 [Puccinia striiformis f. sp. tritici]